MPLPRHAYGCDEEIPAGKNNARALRAAHCGPPHPDLDRFSRHFFPSRRSTLARRNQQRGARDKANLIRVLEIFALRSLPGLLFSFATILDCHRSRRERSCFARTWFADQRFVNRNVVAELLLN